MKPRVSDACADRAERCELCVHWSSGVSLWDTSRRFAPSKNRRPTVSDRIDELVDTAEQALRFLDTVMHSDNEDMRRGAFNRVSIHIQQAATIAREAEAMCEWLAERLEESDDTVLMADTWLAAAREAVSKWPTHAGGAARRRPTTHGTTSTDWVRKCGGGHQCTRGMSCRDFVSADPHASGRLF